MEQVLRFGLAVCTLKDKFKMNYKNLILFFFIFILGVHQ